MENFNLIPIENEGKRVLTTAQLTEEEKQEVCRIPNFDADVFREITGIDAGGV